MLKKFIKYLNDRLFLIWLLLFSTFTIFISPELTSVYAPFATFILFYLIYFYHQKLFKYLIIFVILSLALYYPIGLRYGPLNSGIIAAFIETNITESFAFIKEIRLNQLTFPLLYLFFGIILLRLSKYYPIKTLPPKEQKQQRILNAVLFMLFIFCAIYTPTKYVFENSNNPDVEAEWTLKNSPINVISFYINIYSSINDYYTEKEALQLATKVIPPWHITSANPQYKNYVLIIGESARYDYLSTYGFSLATSPFMDNTKGYINTHYIASAPATYHSFLHSFYFKINDPKTNKQDFSYNIITLAKAAKIKTFWLSNQGSIGRYDTIASRLGMMSNMPYFTKKGAFNVSNEDDFKLVEKLDQLLKEKTFHNKTRLFVLHLMGSHSAFCDRVKENERKYQFINKSISCYVNSILKTDNLIKAVVDLLKKQNESYSLIYFSDHGLAHTNKEDPDKEKLTLEHDAEYKQSYLVPFLKLSSDDHQRTVVNTKRSAVNFLYGFSQWLNITTEELNKNYDFYSDKDDQQIKVFNFKKFVPYNDLKEDPIPTFKETKENKENKEK
ncbi:glucan phosphoethanolaminetransferase (alkaline phosphatase superfamily) [Bisgaardia hudsonensis]|uniref:Glucan phosphoethanolaminetransferase (Alkaline phosphatase superfamily) n=1 Tax=Bisgaardia hudsonensis TaxID=109472 RepID=A0A4R2N008_9PAST|nr:phosphoethanolamine transferase [Bisgaardia hudsonensis]QLB12345.1 hypothetical protein A6A11_01300 [Bisgaardia hudsonensis]TCP12393.1 glucan phosphoethanolaminetransferase (alkaline phosphatase superfamily) [Bisgaardia hudsonensis]